MAPRSLRAFAFGSRRNISERPPSPTFSEVTNASTINLGANGPSKVITRANLKASVQAYESLVNTCATYRAALLTMSKATAAFADAMETCSGLKGPSYEAGTRLQAAAGVHHLIGNLWHVLSESLEKNFEKPLRQHLDVYKSVVQERSQAYEHALRQKSQVIRETEMRSMNRKERNLQNFREALVVLQRQVDELDDLKTSHYHEIVEHEEEVWDGVQGKICLVVRSTMDVFDRFTAKASDPVIEPMLQSVPDPFDSYGPPQSEDQIFSILAPLSINMTTSAPSSATSTPERDPIDSFQSLTNSKITSWLPGTATNGVMTAPESADWANVPFPSESTPESRSISPPTSVSPPYRTSSPPNGGSTRRHSLPASSSWKAENNLRSQLSVIDEGQSRKQSSASSGPSPLPSARPSKLVYSTATRPDSHPGSNWNVADAAASLNEEEGDETPRNSLLFPSPSPPLPDAPSPSNVQEQRLPNSEPVDRGGTILQHG